MIIDHLQNAAKYSSVHPLFAKAFDYISTLDFTNLEDGKYEIDGNHLKAIVSNKQGVTAAVSAEKFECHNQYIDIQVIVNGVETFGWKSRNTCSQPKGEYNAEKDVLFYADAPEMHFTLTNNQFVIFFPEDVHAPGIGDAPAKKVVIKVKI